MKTETISHEITELVLFSVNDYRVYQSAKDIMHNLAKKIVKEVYEHDKALIAWGHLADYGARLYNADHGSTQGTISQIFSPADRQAAAVELQEHYQEELDEEVQERKS